MSWIERSIEEVPKTAGAASKSGSCMADVEGRIRATILVIDRDGCTLLFRGGDPDRPEDGTGWFPPGGGVEAGELARRRRSTRAPGGDRVGGR